MLASLFSLSSGAAPPSGRRDFCLPKLDLFAPTLHAQVQRFADINLPCCYSLCFREGSDKTAPLLLGDPSWMLHNHLPLLPHVFSEGAASRDACKQNPLHWLFPAHRACCVSCSPRTAPTWPACLLSPSPGVFHSPLLQGATLWLGPLLCPWALSHQGQLLGGPGGSDRDRKQQC